MCKLFSVVVSVHDAAIGNALGDVLSSFQSTFLYLFFCFAVLYSDFPQQCCCEMLNAGFLCSLQWLSLENKGVFGLLMGFYPMEKLPMQQS